MTGTELLMIAVIWNSVLQTIWFVWSYNVHKRKHFTDDKEIEAFDNIKSYVDSRISGVENKVEWGDFNPAHNKKYKQNEDGKYNHEEIPGALDGLFATEEK